MPTQDDRNDLKTFALTVSIIVIGVLTCKAGARAIDRAFGPR